MKMRKMSSHEQLKMWKRSGDEGRSTKRSQTKEYFLEDPKPKTATYFFFNKVDR